MNSYKRRKLLNGAFFFCKVEHGAADGPGCNASEQTKQVTAEVMAHQDIDVVFNNAGYGLAGPFEAAMDDQILNITSIPI